MVQIAVVLMHVSVTLALIYKCQEIRELYNITEKTSRDNVIPLVIYKFFFMTFLYENFNL